MKRHFFVGLALVFSVLIFCAVSSSSEAASLKSSIIGKWVRARGDGDKQIEFLKDGTFISAEVAGDYRFIDDNRLRMDARGVAIVFEVSLDRNGILDLTKSTGEATRYITEAMYKKQQEFKTYLEEGIDYRKKGQYDQAIERFSKAIALVGASDGGLLGHVRAYSLRGYAYARIGQYGRAIEDANKIIALDGNADQILGYIYAKKGQYDKATEYVNKNLQSIQNRPTIANNPDYNYGIAQIYSLMDNKAIACKYLSKAIDNGFKDWDKIKKDSDFNKIRNSDCYKEIMEGK